VKIRIYRFEEGDAGAYGYECAVEAAPLAVVLWSQAPGAACSVLERRAVPCVRLVDTPKGVRVIAVQPVPDRRAAGRLCKVEEEEGYPAVFLPARPKKARTR